MDLKLLIWSMVMGCGIASMITGSLNILGLGLLLIIVGEIYERR